MKPQKAAKAPGRDRHRRLGGIRRRLLVPLGLIAFGAAAYGLAGWYGAPWLAERWLADFRAGAAGRTTSLAEARLNPFTLELELTGLQLADPATASGFSAERIRVDFSGRSLLERRPVVDSARIEAARLSLAALSDLSTLARRARSAAWHLLRVDALELAGGSLTVGGWEASAPLGFELSLTGFDGESDVAGRFRLDAGRADGATLAAEGSLAPGLDAASGRLDVAGLDLALAAGALGGPIAASEPAGRLDLEAAFAATSLLSAPALELGDARLELTALALAPTAALGITSPRAAGEADLVLGAATGATAIEGRIALDDTTLAFRDAGLTPAQVFTLTDTTVLLSADRTDGLGVNLNGQLDGAGETSLTLRRPATPGAGTRVSIRAAALPAAMLSAYAADAIDRALEAGTADIALDYTLGDARVDGTLGLLARDLELAEPAAANGQDALSLELALALLEDAEGVLRLELPFAGSALPVRNTAAATLRARLATATATPFDALGSILAGDASAVPFLPGDAALNDRALAAIGQLAEALAARPRLGLRVHGGFDPVADREALAREQIRLHVQLATAGPSAEPGPVDTGSARVQDVLDEFAGERLPPERIAGLRERFRCEGEFESICRRAYYDVILDALVANEAITPTMLSRLGRFRARSIADALRAQDIAEDRIEIVTGGDVTESPFGVGLAVELIAAAGNDAGATAASGLGQGPP